MVEKEEFEKWFEQAGVDLSSAKYNFDGEKYSVAVFLCEQTVEKGLKALIIKKSNELIKTHDLVRLGKKVNLPEKFFDKLAELSSLYTEVRYVPVKDFEKIEVDSFIKFAEEVLEWLIKKI
ncbi:MAG: HEPN domain-containing protein [Nanoarchaeota archaeon]|nr:HEPN domain-containing protein [Nanoarchaeota archaeon]